jgi:hypothetical protein
LDNYLRDVNIKLVRLFSTVKTGSSVGRLGLAEGNELNCPPDLLLTLCPTWQRLLYFTSGLFAVKMTLPEKVDPKFILPKR